MRPKQIIRQGTRQAEKTTTWLVIREEEARKEKGKSYKGGLTGK